GRIEIRCRATDLNLDPNSWRFEWQADASSAWQPVTLQSVVPQQIGFPPEIQGYWQPPAGTRPLAVRGIVSDRAGNSATYQSRLHSPALPAPLWPPPAISAPPPRSTANVFPILPTAPLATVARPAANGANPVTPSVTAAPIQPPSQPWAPTNAARAPFQLWTA